MNVCESQDPVLNFLQAPSTHGGGAVRRIDTHISSVFLAGPRVYKIKRAVRYPFLDFSTLEKRKKACEAEIEVNRRFAPQIYCGVIPITESADGRLAIDGPGKAIEWAVEMKRFDENRTLDRLADDNAIDAPLADALGRAVAEIHEQAPIARTDHWLTTLRSIVEQNDVELRVCPSLFPSCQIADLRAATCDKLRKCQPLLLARGASGLVRRGHGDLHLGNIVLIDGQPVAFDALEFDPLLASTDLLYDLAFLLMDLVERDLAVQANVVLNRYLVTRNRLEDLEGMAALPLFLSIRAAIRAKVLAERLQFVSPAQRAAIEANARRYFDLACRLIDPPKPRLVAIGGLSGTGKSALARMLAADIGPAPGAVILRSDVERKLLFGQRETDKLPPDAYTQDVSARVYAMLQQKAECLIAAGHSVIVDAVFSKGAERSAFASAAAAANAAFSGLFLHAALPTRLARLGSRGPDASDADQRVAEQQESYDLGAMDWTVVDAGGTPNDTLQLAKAAVNPR